MTEPTTEQPTWAPDWATHPGDHLAEHLECLNWSQAEFSRRSGLSPKLISTVIRRKNPVTAETALILEDVLGLKAKIWLGLQADWDLLQARRKRASSTAPVFLDVPGGSG